MPVAFSEDAKASKQQHPPKLKKSYLLTQLDLYNGHKIVVVVVVVVAYLGNL